MNTIQLLNKGIKKLKTKKIRTSQLDTEIILSKILNKTREKMLISLNQKINDRNILDFNRLILRRLKKEPIALILNEKEFWSKNYEVNKSTLIPRPETELMVESLVKIYKNKKLSIIDIGTGSGCILLSLLSELKDSYGVGLDISKDAITIAKKNAKKHNILNNVRFINKSLNDIHNQKYDLVVSNPPYIQTRDIKYLDDDIKMHEPKTALDGGNDGLDLIKKVIYKTKYILKLNGRLALEIGNKQSLKVSKILYKNNFRIENIIRDYDDNIRCFISKYNGRERL